MKFSKRFQPVIDYLVYLFVRTVICVTQSIRIETCHSLARIFASIAVHVLRLRGKLLEENISAAFPEMTKQERSRLTYEMWEHLFLLAIEVAHTPRKINEETWNSFITLQNISPLHSLLCQDRPVIIVTGHFGNFELGGYVLGLLGYPTYTVARKLDNPYLDRFVQQFREETGQFLISKNEGYDDILEVLGRQDVMTFLADQAAGYKGCQVQFFNRKASAYKAIALLSLQFNAPIVACAVTRSHHQPLHFDMTVSGVFDPSNPILGVENVLDMTQWYTTLLEEAVRKQPEQYWWLHGRWKQFQPRPKRVKKED